MYPPDLVAPMHKDLTEYGFEGLQTVEAVDDFMKDMKGTALLVVNSVLVTAWYCLCRLVMAWFSCCRSVTTWLHLM